MDNRKKNIQKEKALFTWLWYHAKIFKDIFLDVNSMNIANYR